MARSRAGSAVILFSAAVLTVAAALSASRGVVSQASYARIAKTAHQSDESELARAKAVNSMAAGWIQVEGTPLSLPVVQTQSERGNAFYLTHDLWGNPSPVGCPFIDDRTGEDDRHVLIYGHRDLRYDVAFTPLARSFEEEVFTEIGRAIWETDEGITVFEPLCALHVDRSYQDIQRFTHADAQELREWLGSLAKSADQATEGWSQRIESAERVLTLSTCSTPAPGTRERTLFIWVSSSEGQEWKIDGSDETEMRQ